MFISPFIFMGFLDILLLKEPDFGTASILFFITIIMLFAGGISLLYLIFTLLFGAAASYFLIFTVTYRRDRILAFLHPFHDKTGIGFQIIQSMYAFARGGHYMASDWETARKNCFFYPPLIRILSFRRWEKSLDLSELFFLFCFIWFWHTGG
jgi:Bacterial cell division membrane protein